MSVPADVQTYTVTRDWEVHELGCEQAWLLQSGTTVWLISTHLPWNMCEVGFRPDDEPEQVVFVTIGDLRSHTRAMDA